MATVRKRGSKWQTQIRRDGFPPLSKTFALKDDALRWGREQDCLADTGELGSVPEGTLAVLLVRYEREITPKKRSAASEHFLLRQIARHRIASLKLSNLNSAVISNFRDDRLKRVSGASVCKELGLLSSVLKTASNEWGFVGLGEPMRQVRKPPSGRARNRRIEPHELPVLDAALRQCRNPLVRDVFLFALATGMRRGEVLSLVWPNVNLANRTAYLPLTKNGETRTVPLSPSALEVLALRQKATQQPPEGRRDLSEGLSGAVFPISANAFRLAWERVKRRGKIADLRFHDLRHEAISRFFEMGLTIPEVSLISGHKDSRMLFRYTHLRPEAVATKLENLSRQ